MFIAHRNVREHLINYQVSSGIHLETVKYYVIKSS